MMAPESIPLDIELRLRQLDLLDRITQISLNSDKLEDVLSSVLDLTLEVFNADRAWFLYPCDPDAPSWNIPMERTRPEWPGLFAQGVDMPMESDISALCRESLAANGPVQSAPDTDQIVPPHIAELFSVQSQLTIALRPKIGKPWLFGLHHCSSAAKHDECELQLFAAIAHRIADAISALIAIRQLRESESHSQRLADSVIDQAGVLVIVLDRNGRIVRFNQACEELSGYGFTEIEGKYPWDILLPPEDAVNIRRNAFDTLAYHPVVRTGKYINYWLSKSGERFLIEWSNTRLNEASGNMEFMVSVGVDITERKRTEENLLLTQFVSDQAPDNIIWVDERSRIVYANEAASREYGYTPEEMLELYVPDINPKSTFDNWPNQWQRLQQEGHLHFETMHMRKDGSVFPIEVAANFVNFEGRELNIAFMRNISGRKAAEEEIQRLAYYDPLTNLPNRRLLMDRLQHAMAASLRNGMKSALLFIDLDHFKTLNDTLGHDIGDLLLKQVAQRLASCVREGDTVARLGGDEFMLIMEGLSERLVDAASQTELICKKILSSLGKPYELAGHHYRSTPSIGATVFEEKQASPEDLMKQADIAMYQAKKSGRNTLCFFDPEMQVTVHAHAALENELRQAIERRDFQLHYQVQVDSQNRILGTEALLRWLHPERGLVLPDEFITLAEETGLILTIGEWVLETACAQLKTWQHDELTRDFVLAVNVSARQFRQAGFVAQVRDAIQRHAIDPRLLKLELTESLLLHDIEDTILIMKILNDIGVLFSLDDFGTGYSSLQYLKLLPFDQIKIDQSFVRDIVTDPSDKAIVKTIIAIAQSLDLDVIAEGVETAEQLQTLKDMCCTNFQGYLFSQPMPIEKFEAILKRAVGDNPEPSGIATPN